MQAEAVPEEYGPDAERQEVRRDEQELRTAQKQAKKMTQARAWSEGSAIINECESDKTMPTKQFLQHQTGRNNHSLHATRKDFEPINENELMRAIRNSHKIERDSRVPRRGQGEQGLEFGQDWRTKNRVCI